MSSVPAHTAHTISFKHTPNSRFLQHRPSLPEPCTHPSSGFVVVNVHHVPHVHASLAGVDEASAEVLSEADVVGAATPLPSASRLLLTVVTAGTGAYRALRARA